MTRQEIADRAAAEKKKREEDIAERKRQMEAKRQAEIDAKAKAAEERRLAAEADAKRKADEAARKAAEAEVKRKAELEAKLKLEETKRLASEAEAKRKADELAKKAAEAEAKQRAAADAKKQMEEKDRAVATADAKRKVDEAEAKRLADETEAKRKADEKQRKEKLAREASHPEDEITKQEPTKRDDKQIVEKEVTQRAVASQRAEAGLLKKLQASKQIVSDNVTRNQPTNEAIRRYEQAVKLRDSLWPPIGVPSGAPTQALSKEKVAHDWPLLQLSSASYSEKLKPGDNVFKGNENWKVLEKIDDKPSGFQAYVVVNRAEARMVLAVRGSASPALAIADAIVSSRTGGTVRLPGGQDATADWKQDIAAIGQGKTPAQFRVTENIIQKLKEQHGDLYSIECTGHSMGGGACAYAASQVPGIHAVAVDPISTGALASKLSYMIDNYIVRGDAPDAVQRVVEKELTGWKYLVNPQGPGLRSGSVAGSTSATVPPSLGLTPIDRHFVDRAVGGIATEMNLQQYQVND